MASQSTRFIRQGSWSALAALVVAAVSAPVHVAPVSAKVAAPTAVPAFTQSAPALLPNSKAAQDIVHGFPP